MYLLRDSSHRILWEACELKVMQIPPLQNWILQVFMHNHITLILRTRIQIGKGFSIYFEHVTLFFIRIFLFRFMMNILNFLVEVMLKKQKKK